MYVRGATSIMLALVGVPIAISISADWTREVAVGVAERSQIILAACDD